MGNSEVGHLNLGAGAVVKQDLLRIDEAIEDGSFFENEALRAACTRDRLHLLGLVSDGGVHASMDHLRALIELAAREGVSDVVVHAFTDGRDTSPDSGVRHVAEVESWGGARIATVSGRYYAMDRDNRWDRTELALRRDRQAAEAEFRAENGEEAVGQAYERGETDEFIKPTLVGGEGQVRRGRRRDLLQLPPRPSSPAHEQAGRARRPPAHDAHGVPRGLGLPGRVPAGTPCGDARVHARRSRQAPAARGRDGEVRPRDLLLQRRRGGPVPG